MKPIQLLNAATLFAVTMTSASFAEIGASPPFTQSVLSYDGEVYGVSIGPGGPDIEFGLDDTNGGIYRLTTEAFEAVQLSDGLGLRNPTGLARIGDVMLTVDGAEIIAFRPDGQVLWRSTVQGEGVFLYDVEPLDDATLLVGDFGNGRLMSVDAASGEVSEFAIGATVPGLARFEIANDGIYAVSWGSDSAWDGGLWIIEETSDGWQSREIAAGFGNAEAVDVVEGRVLVGGYRGHESSPQTKLMAVDPESGSVAPLETGNNSSGISDIAFDGDDVWISYLRDGQWERLKTEELR